MWRERERDSQYGMYRESERKGCGKRDRREQVIDDSDRVGGR